MKKIILNNDRRQFLRGMASMALLFSLNPLDVLSNANITKTEIQDLLSDNEYLEVKREIQTYLLAQQHLKIVRTLDPNQLAIQRDRMIKIIAIVNSPAFKKKYKKKRFNPTKFLEKKGAFTQKPQLSKQDLQHSYQGWYQRNKEDINTAAEGFTLGYKIFSTFYKGATCAASIYLTANPLISAPLCLNFAKSVHETGGFIIDIVGRNKPISSQRQQDTVQLADEISSGPIQGYLKSGSYKFSIDPEILKFSIAPEEVEAESALQVPKNATPQETALINFLKDELKNGVAFKSKEDFEEFLSEYVDKMIDVKSQIFQEGMLANMQEQQEQAQQAREKAAFYRTLNQFLAPVMPIFLGKNQTQLIDLALEIGLSDSTLGPYGWATAVLKLGGILADSKNDEGKFQQTLIKALENIQKQLNEIRNQLNTIQYNQIIILDKLDQLLIIGHRNQKILTEVKSELENLREYKDIESIQEYQNVLRSNTIALETLMGQGNLEYSRCKKALEALYNLAYELQGIAFTQSGNQTLTANEIKERIFGFPFTPTQEGTEDKQQSKDTSESKNSTEKNNTLFKQSLYPSIGLVPLLAQTVTNKGFQVVHPTELYLLCNHIIDWSIATGMKQQDTEKWITGLMDIAEQTRRQLNSAADKNLIIGNPVSGNSGILGEYKQLSEQVFDQLYENIRNNLEESFGKKPFRPSKSLIGFKYYGKPYSLQVNQKDFWVSAKDRAYFSLMKEMGIIDLVSHDKKTRIDRKDTVDKNPISSLIPSQRTPSPPNYLLQAQSSTVIRFPKLTNFEGKLIWPKFQITYTKSIVGTHWDKKQVRKTLGLTSSKKYRFTLVGKEVNDNLDKVWKKQFIKALVDENQQLADQTKFIFKSKGIKSFHDFFRFLLETKINIEKQWIIENACKSVLDKSPRIDRLGLSLLVLGKLNRLITNEGITPYEIEFRGQGESITSMFTTDDIKGNLRYYNSSNLSLFSIENDVTVLFRGRKVKLDQNKWEEYLIFKLKENYRRTVENLKVSLKPIDFKKDCEPYLAACINRLRWFQEVYLKLPES